MCFYETIKMWFAVIRGQLSLRVCGKKHILREKQFLYFETWDLRVEGYKRQIVKDCKKFVCRLDIVQ